jgi:hypothetical protein
MHPYICSSLAPQVSSLEELIQKAKTFVASAKSPATLKAYRNDWQDFEPCNVTEVPPPVAPASRSFVRAASLPEGE